MKKKDLKDLRNKDVDELRSLVAKKRSELASIYAKMKAGQEKNLKRGKMIKRDIAQILTIIREKEIIEEETGSKEEEVNK